MAAELYDRIDAAAPLAEVPRASVPDALRNAVENALRIDMLKPLQRLHGRYGNAVMHHAGLFRMVNLFGPDANRLVLLDRDGIFSARKPWMAIMGRIFPNGLLLRDGADHKHQRKIMHEAFKRGALRSYAERMNPMIERGIASWGDGGGRRLAFGSYKELTLDIAASIFVGVELGPQTRLMNGVFENMVAASMSLLRLPIKGLEFQRGLAGRELLVKYFGGLLPSRRAGDGADMLSRLARAQNEAGDRLADADVVDHMIFLMMAAHDTTTSTLTSMTYELARHPEWQERLREEARALGKPHLAFEDVERAEQLGWVMKETLRRYPPLPVIPRIAEADFAFEGRRVPAGSMVVVAPIHTHHMPEWFRAPYLFDPERFAPGRAEDQRHTHAWIPFGGGPHHCLGLRFAETQVKAIMHQLLLRYRWSVPDGYRMPVQQAPISKPRDGLPVTFTRAD
ncbi:MAG: cytochrome P450 [Proteobacteria bacterium]|nr:MAG: cytochrome P450 [Pseudomonadota bacterium]